MISFDQRADLSEWMDEPCSYDDFLACVRDLEQVNRLTLAYRPTLRFLESVLRIGRKPVHIVDVGSGGGGMLRAIERWAARTGRAVQLTGIDLNPHAKRAAQQMTGPDSHITWVTGDAFSFQSSTPVDVVISSLFTHHLPDGEIVRFLRWMEQVSRLGWFINDLHRERVPYYGFQVLAAVFRWHRFVRHDGPISFCRAFQPADWEGYLERTDIANDDVHLQTFRPARLCLARRKS